MKTKMFAVSASLIIAACGGDSGGGPVGLSDTQKTQLREVMESSNRAQGAAMRASGVKGSQVSSAFSLAVPADAPQTVESLAAKLNKCQFNAQGFNQPNQGQNVNMSLKVNGTDCPILYDFSMVMNSTRSEQHQTIYMRNDIDYQVVDAEYVKLNDVNGFQLHGEMKIEGTRQGVGGGGTFAGKIVSQKYGELPMEIRATVGMQGQEAFVGETRFTLRFPTFTADLQQVQRADRNGQTVKYYINGLEVSEREYNSYLKGVMTASNESAQGGEEKPWRMILPFY